MSFIVECLNFQNLFVKHLINLIIFLFVISKRFYFADGFTESLQNIIIAYHQLFMFHRCKCCRIIDRGHEFSQRVHFCQLYLFINVFAGGTQAATFCFAFPIRDFIQIQYLACQGFNLTLALGEFVLQFFATDIPMVFPIYAIK